jgi:methylenetetrahydrofolate dehydrogenase (NADP+)/methenyltetrahydrofolate cyclohydrolase
MIIFDGKKFAAEEEKILKEKVDRLKAIGITPKMVSILIGENPESELYLGLKKKAAERVVIKMEIARFTDKVKSDEVIKYVKKLNKDPEVHGIMIQLPLPPKFKVPSESEGSKFKVLETIDPGKDIDCLTPENLGLLVMGKPRFLPATVKSVIKIIHSSKFIIHSSNVCIVGGSEIVGKPLAMVLSDAGATVSLCRSATKNLKEFTKKADILISATGVPGLIKKEMVKKGAVVIDVGIKMSNVKIVGDVEKGVEEVAGFLTPVPGGVGPVTVVSLLENLVEGITF